MCEAVKAFEKVVKLVAGKDRKIREQQAEVERLQAIDVILKSAGITCGENAVEGEDGGVVTVCLGTFEEAERLHDLLVG